jgi:hypothetical protein
MATSLVIVLSKLQQIFMYMVAEGGEAWITENKDNLEISASGHIYHKTHRTYFITTTPSL